MPTTFSWPRTEDEHLEHLRDHHGVYVGSMASWVQMFGNCYLPSTVHSHEHPEIDDGRHGHKHAQLWAAP